MKKIFASIILLCTMSTILPYQTSIHTPEFILAISDMMTLPVDCIVNAANSNIQGGQGVDGIITANEKPNGSGTYQPPVGDTSGKILAELKKLKIAHPAPITANGSLPEGQAVITSSGTIIDQGTKTIRFVIATVGPKGPANNIKDKLLFNAYHNSLLLAANINGTATSLLKIINPILAENYAKSPIRSVAFPSISTGIFNYPAENAARMAISGCIKAMQEHPQAFDKVYLVIHPSNVQKPPYAAYAMEMQLPKYKTMLNNSKQPSNVKISILKINKSMQLIYQPSSSKIGDTCESKSFLNKFFCIIKKWLHLN